MPFKLCSANKMVMKFLQLCILVITSLTFIAKAAQADIALTHRGQATGYFIKVLHEGWSCPVNTGPASRFVFVLSPA